MYMSEIMQSKSFFFIGIGGVSMSAIAKILHFNGKRVAGYDRCRSEYTLSLTALGIDVSYDINVNIECYDCIVYTDAISANNRLLIEAEMLGKKIVSRAELLGSLSKNYKSVLAVAGCHGKTTCTAMLAHVFDFAKYDFTLHMGGNDLIYSNAYVKGNDVFITEACEYKRNFLKLSPDVGIILTSDPDHPDCYNTEEELKQAYESFVKNSNNVIRLYGDGKSGESVTFGFDDRATFYAKNIRQSLGKYSFIAYERGKELGKVCLNAYGKHNVLNALATISASRLYGIDFKTTVEGLKRFCGVKRRFEKIGSINGAVCIADYAHHPNEIKATLKTARLVTEGELYVVFQPHTYSRTKCMFKQFVSVLSPVKKLLVYKTYAAREYYDDAGSALRLSSSIKHAKYADCPEDILQFTRYVREGDVILILGAGDIYDIALNLIE
ncbi:MAG: UDP-N-acetylmuramate--L-alanine ligase [Candidatus Coproplasma sp.]